MLTIYAIVGLINAITILILGSIVFFKDVRNRVNRKFFLFTIIATFWSAAYFLWQIATTPSEALFWSRVLMAGAIFIPISYFHYFVTFTNTWKQQKNILISGYIISFLSLIADFTPYFVESVSPKLHFLYWPNPGYLFHPFLIIWILYVIYTIYLAFHILRKARGIFQNQLKYILVGMIIGYIGGITNFLLWYNIPIPPVGNILVSVYVAFVSYAIVRYRLFDIQIQLQNILNRILPVLISIVITTTIAFILFRLTMIPKLVIGIMLLVIHTIFVETMRGFISRSQLSYILFRKTYRYRRALKQLGLQAAHMLNFSALSQRIIDVFVEEVRVKRAALLLALTTKPQEYELIESHAYEQSALQALLVQDAVLAEVLSVERTVLTFDDMTKQLEREMAGKKRQALLALQRLCKAADIHVLIPLSVQQSVVGYILLGEKEGGRPYTVEDLNLFEEVAPDIAIALLNCKQHQEKTILARMLQEEVDRAVQAWQQKSKENEELSNIKSQFITVASHQLRTPISVIRNSLQMVLEDYLNAKDADNGVSVENCKTAIRLLSNAFLASDNLKDTADHILAASEFIGSIPNVHVGQIATEAFFATRVRRAQSMLDHTGKQITLIPEISAELPPFFVSDEKKLAMAIDNILSNAVLYTPKGTIRFTVTADADEFVITIVDTGIGVPETQQAKLFQRFVRLPSAVLIVPDGSGLGLYLARKYTQLLRGSISVDSTEGEGTTFTLHVPQHYSYVAS